MRRSQSIEPPTSASSLLHPALQAALNSLDVQLEAELARYRRQRTGTGRRRTEPADRRGKPTDRSQNYKALDLIAIGAIGGRTQPLQPEAAAPRQPPAIDVPDLDPWQDEQPTSATTAALAVAGRQALRANSTQSGLAPLNLNNAEAIATAPSQPPQENAPDHPAEPEDYLASSEELLRSLAEEEAELRTQREPGLLESLLTPLGIGSLLLLLLSSVTLGYVILNPSSLKFLGVEGIFNPQESAPNTPAPTEPGAAPANLGAPAYPDLSSEEFKDLNLDTLSTLPTEEPGALPAPTASPSTAAQPAPSPAAAPSGIPAIQQQRSATNSPPANQAPAIAPRPLPPVPVQRSTSPAPRAAAPARSSARSSTPARPRPAPAPRAAAPVRRAAPATPEPAAPEPPRPAPAPAAATAPTPAPSPVAVQGDRYRVVVPYTGDQSLEEARRVAPDAFVRNTDDGAQIQVTNTGNQDSAEALQQQLQQQGIEAEVEAP